MKVRIQSDPLVATLMVEKLGDGHAWATVARGDLLASMRTVQAPPLAESQPVQELMEPAPEPESTTTVPAVTWRSAYVKGPGAADDVG